MRIATVATLSFMICWGLVLVVAQIRPFWVDEWRVIYNLKFKDQAALWGPLDFMQQFPRVYLSIVKAFTSALNYSYFSLRLPSFLVGTFTIVLCYRLMERLYPRDHFNRFLFVMILISCSTFTEYFAQIKQYTMELLLSLVALWQLLQLIRPADGARGVYEYIVLCLSFIIVPFFSYSYPVAIAPVFAVVLVQGVKLVRDQGMNTATINVLLRQWLPLLLCSISIWIFYMVDVRQLMADRGMHNYWGHLMMNRGFSWSSFLYNFFNLFAEIGSGMVFWILMGILGTIAFLYGLAGSLFAIRSRKSTDNELIRIYASLLILFVFILFGLGKLPVGEPRLNAFTIPAVSILIIYLLDTMASQRQWFNVSVGISMLLYVGVIGNIYTTFFASFTGDMYAKKMDIYRATAVALREAQEKKLPILITPGVAYPFENTQNLPDTTTVPGDWVLKTHPAYRVETAVPVYGISNMTATQEVAKQLPPTVTAVMVGDGKTYKIVSRGRL